MAAREKSEVLAAAASLKGVIDTLSALDHSTIPPKTGAPYPSYVGRTDGDGHTVAGVRMPALERFDGEIFRLQLPKGRLRRGCDMRSGRDYAAPVRQILD